MSDKQDCLEPIKPGGVMTSASLVIDLAGRRVTAGQLPYSAKKCQHKRIIYCTSERRVWCEDCERNIDGFDALMLFADDLHRMQRELSIKISAVEAEKKTTIISRAAKALDRIWRGANPYAVPCPHCRGGLLPEDFADGNFGRSSREIEIARRKKNAEKDVTWR